MRTHKDLSHLFHRKNRGANCLLFVVALLIWMVSVALTPHVAAEVIYQTGFELPTFIEGQLTAQDGWVNASTTTCTMVQSQNVATGSQATRIAMTGEAGLFGSSHRFSPDASAFPDQVLVLSVDAWLGSAAKQSWWTVLATRFEEAAADGHTGVNIEQSGQINLYDGSSPHPTGVYISRDRWNHFALVLDFATRTEAVYYNGGLVIANVPFGGKTNLLRAVSFYAQLSGTDIGYFDNFSVSFMPETWPVTQGPRIWVTGSQHANGTNLLALMWTNSGAAFLLESSVSVAGNWSKVTSPWITNGNWVSTTVANAGPAQFYRLRSE